MAIARMIKTEMPKMAKMDKMPEPPSTVYVNLNKNSMSSSHLKLGAKMTLVMECKVTSVHQDKYGKSMNLDIVSMEHKSDDEEE